MTQQTLSCKSHGVVPQSGTVYGPQLLASLPASAEPPPELLLELPPELLLELDPPLLLPLDDEPPELPEDPLTVASPSPESPPELPLEEPLTVASPASFSDEPLLLPLLLPPLLLLLLPLDDEEPLELELPELLELLELLEEELALPELLLPAPDEELDEDPLLPLPPPLDDELAVASPPSLFAEPSLAEVPELLEEELPSDAVPSAAFPPSSVALSLASSFASSPAPLLLVLPLLDEDVEAPELDEPAPEEEAPSSPPEPWAPSPPSNETTVPELPPQPELAKGAHATAPSTAREVSDLENDRALFP